MSETAKVKYVLFSLCKCMSVCVCVHAKGSAGGHNVLWLQRRRKVHLYVWERANASHAAGGLCAFWLQCEDRQMSRWRSGGGECGVWGIVGNARLLCPLRSTCLHTAHTSNKRTPPPVTVINCVFSKSPVFKTYILQSDLGWVVISHAQMHHWSVVQMNKLSWCMNSPLYTIRSV